MENKFTEYMTIYSAFNVYFIPIYAIAGSITAKARFANLESDFSTRKSTHASA